MSTTTSYEGYDYVSAGEVCSINTAQKLGIYDAHTYYINDSKYANIKTFNEEFDRNQGGTTKALCYPYSSNEAYPLCILSSNIGAGIGFVRKKTAPNTCVTYDCPTGFERDSRGSCTKPLEDAIVSKLSRCDERWYDWFTVPNYHLGNAYWSDAPGKCYAPCPSGNLPNFAVDPVDGAKVDFSSDDHLDQCISRADYFAGKYSEGSEYCPLAWIKRMTLNKLDVIDYMNSNVNDVAKDNGSTKNPTVASALLVNIPDRAQALVAQVGSSFENLALPTKAMHAACKRLHTPERLAEAYEQCRSLQEDETNFANKLRDGGDNEDIQKKKIAVMKNACNGVFCNEKVDPYVAESIGRDPICFKPSKLDIAAENKPHTTPNAEKGEKFFRKSIGYAIKIFLLTIFGVLLYFFVMDFLWPKVVRPIIRLIRLLFTGWKGSKHQDVDDAIIKALDDRVNAKMKV
jgi:hypothetical protein